MNGSFGCVLRCPGSREMGSKIPRFSKFDQEAEEVLEICEGPRLDVYAPDPRMKRDGGDDMFLDACVA